jgi:uncharacterized protein YPO0396
MGEAVRNSSGNGHGRGDMLDLELTDQHDPHQFRISKVQVLNWGAYEDLQTMDVSRSGMVLLGPSGRGKSTLLDAMSSVIMPNPQDFNQAARDDRGTGRQRTVYSYARGYVSTRQDENQISSTKEYLRRPSTEGFISGTAITWENKLGQRATAFRLAWIGPDVTEQETVNRNTVYGFVNDLFDLRRLPELQQTGRSQLPVTPTAFEPLIDLSRGDVVHARQAVLHSRMRTVMGLGVNEKSQERALDLLRRAQSSKGFGTINKLFTTLVLTEPAAMSLWSTVLDSYRETSNLYTLFEEARRQLEVLEPLPGQAEKYRDAGRQAVEKARLYSGDGQAPTRFAIWHAEKIYGWAQRKVDDLLIEKAVLLDDIDTAARAKDAAERHVNETIGKITAAGGDRSQTVEVLLQHAKDDLDRITSAREDISGRLQEFGLALPTSAGDLDLTQSNLSSMLRDERTARDEAKEQALQTAVAHSNARIAAADKVKEISRLKARRSLIPEYAEANRQQIVDALHIPVEDLVYAGELMEIGSDHRLWEKALAKLLFPLSSTLLVREEDYLRVRRYAHDARMNKVLHVEPVAPGPASRPGPEGSIAGLITVEDHPFADWVTGELRDRYNFRYVERERDLDQPLPGWARGAITPSGMTTGRRPGFTKDDRDFAYTWIGRDPRHLLEHLAAELESLRSEEQLTDGAAEEASTTHDRISKRLWRLQSLTSDLVWEKIDDTAARKDVEQRVRELAEANSPQVAALKAELTRLLADQSEKGSALKLLKDRLASVTTEHADWCDAQDKAQDLADQTEPLNPDERQLLASLPFRGPAMPDEIVASKSDPLMILKDQVGQHRKDHEHLEEAIKATIGAYLSLDQRIARNYDRSIDSLDALLHVHEQLERDSLPRAKSKWLNKTDKELNTELNRLLTQIEVDGRKIKNGMRPINDVLASVKFREKSRLSIEPQPTANQRRLDEFTASIREYTSNTVGQDVQRNAAQIEKSFLKLRDYLGRLEDQSRSNEEWRRSVFDAREHFDFRAIELKPDGTKVIHQGVAGMSGGEGQELIAFLLAAALRLRLSEGGSALPRYASVILDEGFVKSDSDYTARSLKVLKVLGFQLIVGAPREKATAFEDYMDRVAYISHHPDHENKAQIYPMTMADALALDTEEDS